MQGIIHPRGPTCAPASAGGEVPAGFRFAAPEQPKVSSAGWPPSQQSIFSSSYKKPVQQTDTVPSLFPGILGNNQK
jgi:hypothetical protein